MPQISRFFFLPLAQSEKYFIFLLAVFHSDTLNRRMITRGKYKPNSSENPIIYRIQRNTSGSYKDGFARVEVQLIFYLQINWQISLMGIYFLHVRFDFRMYDAHTLMQVSLFLFSPKETTVQKFSRNLQYLKNIEGTVNFRFF